MEIVPLSVIQPGQGRIGSIEGTLDRARYALSLPFRSFYELMGKSAGRKAIIVGGGPSIKDTLRDIRRAKRLSKKIDIIALNKTHDWLLGMGIVPDYAIMIDPKPWVATYVTPSPKHKTKYLLGSKLHKDTYDKFMGCPDQVYLWQTWEHKDEELETLPREFPHKHIIHIPGYSTVGLRALNVTYDMGHRDLELHGYDSSHDGAGMSHGYDKRVPVPDNEPQTIIIDGGDGMQRAYHTNTHMVRQLSEFFEATNGFDDAAEKHEREWLNIRVAGTGALQYAVCKRIDRHRTRVRHVDERYNLDPDSMPGGIRDVPAIGSALDPGAGLQHDIFNTPINLTGFDPNMMMDMQLEMPTYVNPESHGHPSI